MRPTASAAESIAGRCLSELARSPPQQLRQLGDVRRYAPRLVLRHELGGRAPARLLLVIHKRKRLAVGVVDDVASRSLLNGPGISQIVRSFGSCSEINLQVSYRPITDQDFLGAVIALA